VLHNFDPAKPLYIIGTGMPAHELLSWIRAEHHGKISLVDRPALLDLPNDIQCIPGFANREFRLALFSDSIIENYHWVTYVHPSSVMLTEIENVGLGTVIQPMVTVGHSVDIGKFGWITPYCLVSHGDVLGTNVILGPRTIVGGSTQIGNNVTVGLSSTICDKISICSDCEFLMTSVVTKNIEESGRYYGNKKTSPLRK
jgi:UDP-3-O-[3-hydroxymyristoyl] glucosamine N-acyltransferase